MRYTKKLAYANGEQTCHFPKRERVLGVRSLGREKTESILNILSLILIIDIQKIVGL
jgi:hypothetical protein